MIKIALCDDNERIIQHFSTLLHEVAEQEGVEISIHAFSSGENLLFELDENCNAFDIMYLDIEMGRINGIETADILRRKGCQSILIFLTNNERYVFQSFDVQPLHYILKTQVTMQKFHDIFVKAIAQKQKNDEDVFICEFNDVKKIIPLHEIYYFDIRNRVVTVHYGQSEFSFYSKLDIIEETLANKHFVRIHRSFIVNLCYIDHIVSKSVFLINKEELPIGATYQKSLKEQFSNYLLEIA